MGIAFDIGLSASQEWLLKNQNSSLCLVTYRKVIHNKKFNCVVRVFPWWLSFSKSKMKEQKGLNSCNQMVNRHGKRNITICCVVVFSVWGLLQWVDRERGLHRCISRGVRCSKVKSSSSVHCCTRGRQRPPILSQSLFCSIMHIWQLIYDINNIIIWYICIWCK